MSRGWTLALCGLLCPAMASADPFNVFPPKTQTGSLGFNPYFIADSTGALGGSLWTFAGVHRNLDLVVGLGGWSWRDDAGVQGLGFGDLLIRLYPNAGGQFAFALHGNVEVPDLAVSFGPQFHLAPTFHERFSLWANIGVDLTVTSGAATDGKAFALIGPEVHAGPIGISIEVDPWLSMSFEDFSLDWGVEVVPNLTAWFGPGGGHGIGVGVGVPVRLRPVWFGVWYYTEFDVTRPNKAARAFRAGPLPT